MAETQYRQSLFAIHHALARWVGSARTPPPAFPFLHIDLSKSAGAATTIAARFDTGPSRRKRDRSPGHPGKPRIQSGDCCPLHARQYMSRETPVINLNRRKCQPRKWRIFAADAFFSHSVGIYVDSTRISRRVGGMSFDCPKLARIAEQ